MAKKLVAHESSRKYMQTF